MMDKGFSVYLYSLFFLFLTLHYNVLSCLSDYGITRGTHFFSFFISFLSSLNYRSLYRLHILYITFHLISRFSFLVSRSAFLVSRFAFLVSRFLFLVSRFSLLSCFNNRIFPSPMRVNISDCKNTWKWKRDARSRKWEVVRRWGGGDYMFMLYYSLTMRVWNDIKYVIRVINVILSFIRSIFF